MWHSVKAFDRNGRVISMRTFRTAYEALSCRDRLMKSSRVSRVTITSV